MLFQEFIISQLVRAGFTDAEQVFEENDHLFVQAFTHASFAKDQPNGSIFKMLGDRLISAAVFLYIFDSQPTIDQCKMTNALQHVGDMLEKEGRAAGFEKYILKTDGKGEPIRDTVKAFCGVLGVLKRDTNAFITMLTGSRRNPIAFDDTGSRSNPIAFDDTGDRVINWLENADCANLKTKKHPVTHLKELWELIYAHKYVNGRKCKKSAMFKSAKDDTGFSVTAVDPFMKSTIATAHGKTEKEATRTVSEIAVKLLHKTRATDIKLGKDRRDKQ